MDSKNMTRLLATDCGCQQDLNQTFISGSKEVRRPSHRRLPNGHSVRHENSQCCPFPRDPADTKIGATSPMITSAYTILATLLGWRKIFEALAMSPTCL